MPDLTNTVHLHRVIRATPERIYRAFIDPDAMVKWLPPHGFVGKIHHMDARIGHGYQMSFTNFSTGNSHSFSGQYLELSPYKQIKYKNKFDDPHLSGEILVTVSLKQVICGSELTITQEDIPSVIPLEFCYLGWQESLTLLSYIVEPEIPDGA